MNDSIVDSINSRISYDDELYYLGDWSFGHKENVIKFRERLNVRNIHFILGNHDHYILNNKNKLLSDKIFTTISHYQEIKVNGQLICLFHYPMIQWHQAHRGSWLLSGHCHGNEPQSHPDTAKYKCIDIGWDIFRKPLDTNSIRQIMDHKVNKGH